MASRSEGTAALEPRVQCLQFDKRQFSPSEARRWAVRNGFRAPATEDRAHVLCIQQEPMGNFKPGSLRSMTLEAGVIAVLGDPKRGCPKAAAPATFRGEIALAKKEATQVGRSLKDGFSSLTCTVRRTMKKLSTREKSKKSRKRKR